MRTKDQVFENFQKFFYQIACLSGKNIKSCRTNSGWKFANQAFEKYTTKKSIK